MTQQHQQNHATWECKYHVVFSKRGKTGGGMNLRFTGGHELELFWECCRPPTSMAYRMPI